MTDQAILLALIPVAYLLGSIPFGLMVGKAKGVDPRTSGSGNIGATNVGRLLGTRYFFLVFLLDMLKGMLPMIAASVVLSGDVRSATDNLLHLFIGLAGICGHMFSVFLRFTGGKGVATSAGVALGLYPYFTYPAIAAIAVWALVYAVSRYVSLASIIAAIFFPVALLIIAWLPGWGMLGANLPLLVFAVIVGAMIVWRHRSNIARLRSGTESQFKGKAQ